MCTPPLPLPLPLLLVLPFGLVDVVAVHPIAGRPATPIQNKALPIVKP
jgi:hypothetical protein